MASRHRIFRSTTGVLLAAALAVGLAACGGGDDDTAARPDTAAQPAADASFNDADVRFAQGMLPHHLQAVEMAGLAKSRAASPGVKKLATSILAGQQPEILQLRELLAQWGRSLDTSMEGMSGMESMRGMPGMDTMEGMANLEATMSGMATSGEVAELRAAKGRKFDRLLLTMMLEHHRSAVMQAQAEQTEGKDAAAIALAKKIEATQSAEIRRMDKLRKA